MTRFGILISLLIVVFLSGIGFLIYKSQNEALIAEPVIIKDSISPITETGNGDRVASGYVAGHVTIGPFCPVEREGETCEVPPEAYSSREVIVYESNGVTVKEKGKIDAEGNYKITLGPGNYFIQIEPAGIGPGEKKPVTVKSFETTTLNFDIDTGIR